MITSAAPLPCCCGSSSHGFCAKVNPDLTRLQAYPFEKLRALFAGITPPAGLSPIRLSIGDAVAQDHLLGPDVLGDQAPQILVPKGHWQKAESLGHWTLVSCTVSPGFRFEGFELAAPDWDLPRG